MMMSPRTEMSFASHDSYASGVDHLIKARGHQEQLQRKILMNLTRQAGQEAERRAAWEDKAMRREGKLAAIEEEREAERAARAQRQAEAEQYRRSRLEAAAAAEEGVRQAARNKVESTEQRVERFETERALQHQHNMVMSSRAAARRKDAYRHSVALAEARRRALQRREEVTEEIMRQKEELRSIQLQIKAEEDFMREQRRQDIRARADAELAARTRYHHNRTMEKAAGSRRKVEEMEALKRLKAEEARQRAEYVRLQARQAASRDAAERDRLRQRVQSKLDRADALAAQRDSLVADMARARQQMQVQEAALRASLEELRRSGANFVLPPDVKRSLDAMGGGFYLTTMRTASSPGVSPAHHLQGADGREEADGGMGGGINKRAAAALRASAAASPGAAWGGVSASGGLSPAMKRVRVRPTSASALVKSTSGADALRPLSASLATTTTTTTRRQRHYTSINPLPEPGSRKEEELRGVLQEEISKEAERQAVMAGVSDERERVRLNKIFSVEREAAKARILGLSGAVGLSTSLHASSAV